MLKANVERKIIAQIQWTVEDLKEALAKAGVKPSDDTINRFILDRYATQTLEEVCIQFGWEILSDIISTLQTDGVLPSTEIVKSTPA